VRRAKHRTAWAGAAAVVACLLAALAFSRPAPSPDGPGTGSPGRAGVSSALLRVRLDDASGRTPGRDYYVSPNGSDANGGSHAEPWRTLGHAAARVGAGDAVHVAPGSYAGPLVLRKSGKPRKRIRFVSVRPGRARISAASSGSLAVVEVRGDYVDFEGFDVTGSGGDGTQGIDLEGSQVRAIGNRVHDIAIPCGQGDNGGAGIVAGGGRLNYRNHNIDVIGNVVHDIGDPGGCSLVHGIYAAVPRVRIVNNLVYRPAHDCITSWHRATQLTVANNTLVQCTHAGITVGSGDTGASAGGNRKTVVVNNIVYGSALSIAETSDGHHPVGPGNRYLHNLIFRSGPDGHLRPGDALRTGAVVAGTIEADPRFRARSFDLRQGSPAIDAGTSTGAPRSDVVGVRRPQGPRVDIGAYEWRARDGRGA
jgi:hypothetical protein